MNTPTSVEISPPVEEWQPDDPRDLDDVLRQHVVAVADRLYHRYVRDVPSAVADLAQLRRAVGRAPGEDLVAHQIVFGEAPVVLLGRTDEPSPHEWAAHAALTLFALHQQSRREVSMHRRGNNVGAAAARLGRATREEAVRDRFHELGTAATRAALMHHLRGLVTQLRGASIPLDYGQLAVDLRRLEVRSLAPQVRLAWGRTYHRRVAADTKAATAPAVPATATSTASTVDENQGDPR